MAVVGRAALFIALAASCYWRSGASQDAPNGRLLAASYFSPGPQAGCPSGYWQVPPNGRNTTTPGTCKSCPNNGASLCYQDGTCRCVQASKCSDLPAAYCVSGTGCVLDTTSNTCKDAPAPPVLRVTGATGALAGVINGYYTLVNDTAWVKQDVVNSAGWTIWNYGLRNTWVITTADHKAASEDVCVTWKARLGPDPSAETAAWTVAGEGVKQYLNFDVASWPTSFRITGATGPYAGIINGDYSIPTLEVWTGQPRTVEMRNNRPVWLLYGSADQMGIWYNADRSRWVLSSWDDRQNNRITSYIYAVVTEADPTRESTWYVADGTQWSIQPLSVQDTSPSSSTTTAQPTTAKNNSGPNRLPGEAVIGITVACAVFAGVAMFLAVYCWARHQSRARAPAPAPAPAPVAAPPPPVKPAPTTPPPPVAPRRPSIASAASDLSDEGVAALPMNVEVKRKPPEAPRIPSYWKNQDEGAKFEDWIDLSKDELSIIEGMMTTTWTGKRTRDRTGEMPIGMDLVKAFRIENSELWSKYARRCLQLRQERETFTPVRDILGKGLKTDMNWHDRVASDFNEVYVWHGTTPSGASGIASGGFRIDLAGTRAGTMFGKGVYFAECTSKSDEYAGDDQSGPYKGVYCMLLCRAVLGETKRIMRGGKGEQKEIEDAVSSKACDSIVGDREACVGTYREFIVYDAGQAYPEYVILYLRKYEKEDKT